jgi:hypothetical protein
MLAMLCVHRAIQPFAVLRWGRSIQLRVLEIVAVLALLVLPIAPTVFGKLTAVQQAKLLAADSAAGDFFGTSVAVSGDTAIVGAPRDDDNGNESDSAYVFTLEADNIPPETSIGSAVDGNGTSLADGDSTLSDSIEITFSGTDNAEVVSFECSLDGAAFSTCTSPFTASGLSFGSHTFEVRAVDTADNTDPTPASFTWTIVTPAEATQELIEDVEALNLERGIENSLIARLDSTIRSLENGNVRAAINSLQSFINTVEAQAGNNIPQEDADRLIASAQSIIDALSSS